MTITKIRQFLRRLNLLQLCIWMTMTVYKHTHIFLSTWKNFIFLITTFYRIDYFTIWHMLAFSLCCHFRHKHPLFIFVKTKSTWQKTLNSTHSVSSCCKLLESSACNIGLVSAFDASIVDCSSNKLSSRRFNVHRTEQHITTSQR